MARAAVALILCGLLSLASSAPLSIAPTAALPARGEVYGGPQDPTAGTVKATWTVVQQATIPGITAGLMPGSNDVLLYAGRPSGAVFPAGKIEGLAAVADWVGKTCHNITVDSNPFCTSLAPTTDGRMVMYGGSNRTPNHPTDGRKAIRAYDPKSDSMVQQVLMAYNRWYPTSTLLADGRVMIHGGTTSTSETGKSPAFYEVYDPAAPKTVPKQFTVEPDYLAAVVQNFYPFNYVLPTGDVWNQINNQIRIIKPDGSYRKDPVTGKYMSVPGFPATVITQYPRTATSVMLPLRPDNAGNYNNADILVMGGAPKSNLCRFGAPDAYTLAVRDMYRIRVSWQLVDGDWKYSFGKWIKEDMGIARSGPDSTLLPNGDVVITNGGQTGCPGGTENGIRRNFYPAFWPVLYQPNLIQNKRVTILPASPLARMYHNTATLTRDGNIAIAGCDSCGAGQKGKSGLYLGMSGNFWQPSPFARYELRDELFKVPYTFDTKEMPAIIAIKGQTADNSVVKVTYGESVQVTWGNADKTRPDRVPIKDVVLVAPSSSTHGFNNNQRVVSLVKTVDAKTGTITVKMPPNANVAPPQMYLMFIMNGKTYGRSRWVHLN